GPEVTADASPGDSIAVNGVCLTVTATSGSTFTADVMAETLRRSALGALAPGSPVNLERPLRVGGRLGGHLVQGHVDGVAAIVSRTRAGPGRGWGSRTPPGRPGYSGERGWGGVEGGTRPAPAVGDGDDGAPPWFEVSLTPATLSVTTLGSAQPGSDVNLEVDVIGKYVERLLAGQEAARP